LSCSGDFEIGSNHADEERPTRSHRRKRIKAGAQQIEVRARCSDCAACDGKGELISSPWGSERVLSARFWSQHASQRGPPQRDISSWRAFTADQQSGLCEKELTLKN
jgi:hypothetical protein